MVPKAKSEDRIEKEKRNSREKLKVISDPMIKVNSNPPPFSSKLKMSKK